MSHLPFFPGTPSLPSFPGSPGGPCDPLTPSGPGGPIHTHTMHTQRSIVMNSGFVCKSKDYQYLVSWTYTVGIQKHL